jgi:hypothetical protein
MLGSVAVRIINALGLRRVPMKIPGLGEVVKKSGCYYSQPIPVPMLAGQQCRIVLDGYDKDDRKEDFHAAIANFLSGSPSVLREANEPLFRYYKDCEDSWHEQPLQWQNELWQHIQFGEEVFVRRRLYGDKGIYISIDCGCDWEPEHGLELVLKNGLKVNKLGECDGHLTNADAYADESLEHVIYRER